MRAPSMRTGRASISDSVRRGRYSCASLESFLAIRAEPRRIRIQVCSSCQVPMGWTVGLQDVTPFASKGFLPRIS